MPGFNDDLGVAASYYARTANPAPDAPGLDGSGDADMVVIGGGCTGLSAAYHAARAGLSVILLEGGRIGWGASGRNGGQLTPGLRIGARGLIDRYGRDHARLLFRLAVAAQDETVALIRKHGIDCDIKLTGHIDAAIHKSDLASLQREIDCRSKEMDYPHCSLLSAAQMADEVGRPYAGGMLDPMGGHYHPLNYTLGLAQAAADAGATLHERSTAIGLRRTRDGVVVETARGEVRAGVVVLAGDALLGELDPSIARYIMPVANYIAATAPLLDPAAIIARDRAISDSRFVVNYYRLSADGRLLFGGGERYTTRPPADMAAFVRPFLEREFPQLRETPIDTAWGGLVSVTRTRLPHIGREGPILWAHGYSGKGAALSTLSGRLLADAAKGDAAELELFASMAPPVFPGGTRLRTPLHTLAMIWFAMRDRLGV